MKKIIVLFSVALMLFGATASQAKWKAKHVVFIGCDGWGAYSVPKATNIPNIKYFMDNGAYTLHKRSVFVTASAINWSSMINGCPTEIHGYTEWNSRTPEFPQPVTNSRGKLPDFFSIFKEQCPQAESVFINFWDVMYDIIDTAAISKIVMMKESNTSLHNTTVEACKLIKSDKPTFTFVRYEEPDEVGHAIGHDTPAYYDSLAVIDKCVGEIVQATKDAGIYDETIFVMTSDHGGVGHGHGGRTLLEMETPFIICGKGVKKMGEFKESMMQYDVAATFAYIFGLKQPQVWTGRPMSQVFK